MIRRRRGKGLAHVGIERRTLKEEPWRELSAPAKIFYLHLKGRFNGSNNGDIKLPYSAMRGVKGCSDNGTISRAVKELEATGWIKKKQFGGHTRWDNLYKLTFKYDFYGCKE
jgi:hypothetical protein